MKKHPIIECLAALLITLPSLAGASECQPAGDPADIADIQARRAAFNQAIAGKDVSAIEDVLADDVVLVSGTDSDLFLGRDAQVAIWRGDFGSDDRAIYVRTPRCLRVSGIVPVALEHGAWRGERVNDPDAFAAGSYAAKWRKLDGEWRLEGELFSTESCGGGFCPEPPAGE